MPKERKWHCQRMTEKIITTRIQGLYPAEEDRYIKIKQGLKRDNVDRLPQQSRRSHNISY